MPRLLSWNVNGLRAFLKRQRQLLPAALEAVGADIICFQETKLTKAELDSSVAIADGWDSFFSCTHGKSGYSGTATFCRSSTTVPVAAEEGVTGILQQPATEDPLLPQVLARYSREQLKELDAEGRCVITDHAAFVLFNIYGPAIGGGEGAEDRFAFKLAFCDVVHLRIQKLQEQGRSVIVVGDLNISPAPVDSCCSGTGEDLEAFLRRKDRVWLNTLLEPQGPFVDMFRHFQPARREAYTCWNQASGARLNNYGSRIDLILAADAPSCQPGQGARAHISFCDISPEWQGSDHAPVWADLTAHIPLCRAPMLPRLASKNLFTGKQQSMTAFLRGRTAPSSASPQLDSASSDAADAELAADATQRMPRRPCPQVPSLPGKRPASAASSKVGGPVSKRQRPLGSSQQSMRSFLSRPAPKPQGPPVPCTTSQAQAACSTVQPGTSTSPEPGPHAAAGGKPAAVSPAAQPPDGADLPAPAPAGIPDQPDTGLGSSKPLQEDAAAAWKRIQTRMQPPKCFGHGEDCVIRQVKKGGPTQGRLFACCARPDGPKPHGRCDHFVWCDNRRPQGSSAGQRKTASKAL